MVRPAGVLYGVAGQDEIDFGNLTTASFFWRTD